MQQEEDDDELLDAGLAPPRPSEEKTERGFLLVLHSFQPPCARARVHPMIRWASERSEFTLLVYAKRRANACPEQRSVSKGGAAL